MFPFVQGWYTECQASLAVAFSAEEVTVAETYKKADLTPIFECYKLDVDAETAPLKSDLETSKIASSSRVFETGLRDLKTRVRHQGHHIKARETAYRDL